MRVDWTDLVLAYLHDPPDKALGIRGHEERASRYASAALKTPVSKDTLHGGTRTEDQLASIVERLPMPTAGKNGERAVEPSPDGTLEIRHPLSGTPTNLAGCKIDEARCVAVIEDIVRGYDDPRRTFLALWRLLPDELVRNLHPAYGRLPADTRIPDHTIWHHLDMTAGLSAALSGAHGRAYLSCSLGPVQRFIEAARSVRDLWSGSAILSWLAFQAMVPVIDQVGPTSVVFPSLRGTPLMDLWLRRQGGTLSDVDPNKAARKTPCLPNRFLAVVPWGPDGRDARDLAKACEEAATGAWRRLADAVRRDLGRLLAEHPGWDRRWDEQIDSYFEICTAVLPERECDDSRLAKLFGRDSFDAAWPKVAAVRNLANAIPPADRPKYDQASAGRWQAQLSLSARVMEARRSVRHVPPSTARATNDRFPTKCSLLGSYEQMGPDGLEESKRFWEVARKKLRIHGVHLRKGERFCAVALAKRFSVPAVLADELDLSPEDVRFPDTATVAAKLWLKDADIDPDEIRRRHKAWSGQWLHWPRPDFDEDEDKVPPDLWEQILGAKDAHGSAPSYYAVLMMDADRMGKWLRGDNTPSVRAVLHPKLRAYYEGLTGAQAGLNAARPVGPALHAAISEALTNFAVHVVPAVIDRHRGTVIYAGGDDVLALLPSRTALACARELRLAFRGEPAANGGADPGFYRTEDGRDILMMGPKATLSAGLAVVHYKEDLRLALDEARRAERRVKDCGRNALAVAVLRRSGEHSSALCEWELVERFDRLTIAFAEGASDRWAYRLRAELTNLETLPIEAVEFELRRLVQRTDDETRSGLKRFLLGESEPGEADDAVARVFRDSCELRARRAERLGGMVEDFVTLCQSASFLARGRDE